MSTTSTQVITARAPAKAILFGEHAVNRGQQALAVSVGLYATCQITVEPHVRRGYVLRSEQEYCHITHGELANLAQTIDQARAQQDYAAIQALAAADFFAPQCYILAALLEQLPVSLQIHFASAIPRSAGLGSGGAAYVALATLLASLVGRENDHQLIGTLAQRGDIVAHGGVASGLDTQTSLHGGAICYSVADGVRPLACADGLCLVIGHTGVIAATSAVNGRVRAWLAEQPTRLHYFQEIGTLARYGEAALAGGNWAELGRLMNLNQLLLERIGVSCPELEALNNAALAAGALGAKLSGSGGGGIMLALVEPHSEAAVAAAIEAAGGTAISAPIGVAGSKVIE
jgi:mevalonate kinase